MAGFIILNNIPIERLAHPTTICPSYSLLTSSKIIITGIAELYGVFCDHSTFDKGLTKPTTSDLGFSTPPAGFPGLLFLVDTSSVVIIWSLIF